MKATRYFQEQVLRKRRALVGLDIDQASQKLDLSTLEAVDLPLGNLRAA